MHRDDFWFFADKDELNESRMQKEDFKYKQYKAGIEGRNQYKTAGTGSMVDGIFSVIET